MESFFSQQTASLIVVFVVLVVELVLVVFTVVTLTLVVVMVETTVLLVTVVLVLVVGGPHLPSGLQMASSTNAPPRLVHVASSMLPPMAHEPSN
jgi:hypothetical protein